MMISALLLSLYISCSYVAAIYVSSKGIDKFPAKRDDPRAISKRMKSIVTLIALNVVLVSLALYWFTGARSSLIKVVLNLGLVPGWHFNGSFDFGLYVYNICRSLWLVAVLYVGPLTDTVLYYVLAGHEASFIQDSKDSLFNIWGLRNYVFGPITEEIVYTSMLLTANLKLLPSDHQKHSTLLWKLPLLFGLAHVHHAYELIQAGNHTIPTVILNTIFQLMYTTLFGSLTNFVFLQTGGNLWACIFLHAFCNIMGFPQGSSVTQHFTYVKPRNSTSQSRLLNIWNKLYIGSLLLGLLFFKDAIQSFQNLSTNILSTQN